MICYNTFSDVIDRLNESQISYLILRNYDNLLDKQMYMDGHGDVDMLVEDSKAIANYLDANTYTSQGNDGTHFYVIVDGKKVSLDMRHIGDGYYCKRWQQDMLKRRVKKDGFFVMASEDHFYSLIYHSILQKPFLSKDYANRLKSMANQLGIPLTPNMTSSSFITLLEKFMKQNGYSYTYPLDIYVPLHTRLISSSLIEKNYLLSWKHWKFDTQVALNTILVKLYHLLRYGKFSYSMK